MTRHLHISAPGAKASATAAVAAVLERLRAEGDPTPTVITLEPTTYYFDREGASRRVFTASGIPDAEKSVAFDLEGLSHVTVDGGGAELIFRDRMTPFSLRDCRAIRLQNFTVDFAFSRYCQGTVTASDASGFTLAIDPDCFSVEVDNTGHLHFLAGSDDFSTENTEVLLANEIFGRAPWDYIFVGDTDQPREGLATGLLETDATRVDAGHLRFTYRPGTRALVFPVSDVRMYRGGGMGIVAHASCDIELDRVTIAVRPGRPEVRSTTADGLYFVQCFGTVHIHDSVISRTLDDALNIHGIYTCVESCTADGDVVATVCFDPHKEISPFGVGDIVSISDGQSRRVKATATVTACTILDDRRTALVLSPVPELAVGDYLENITRSATFVFERNRVDHCPHLRISGPAPMRIRDNRFDRIQAILVSDLMEFWYESGCVRDMVIEGNRFENCPRIGGGHPIYITCTRGEADVHHSGIVIANNRFVSETGHAACIEFVDGVTLTGNVAALPDGTSAPDPYIIRGVTDLHTD